MNKSAFSRSKQCALHGMGRYFCSGWLGPNHDGTIDKNSKQEVEEKAMPAASSFPFLLM